MADNSNSKPSHRVLVIDDDPLVCDVVAEILTLAEIEPLLACSGAEAVDLYGQQSQSIDLVLLDATMSDMSTYEVCERLCGANPGVCIVMTSGYLSASRSLDHPQIAGFIQKPYTAQALIAAVRSYLAG